MGLVSFFAGLGLGLTIIFIVIAVCILVASIIAFIYFLFRKEKHLQNLPQANNSFKLNQGKEVNKKK